MNIIQMQDRLKGLSNSQLVDYVEKPRNMQGSGIGQGGTSHGYVPTYLVLGEMERRETMRKEYEASQAEQPTQTVAEEIIAKAAMPTGIGALTNNMAPQMAPEEVMSSSESISETGIAPLPTQNMTQEFARGGIVGYARGGGILDKIKEYGSKLFTKPQAFLDKNKRFDPQYKGEGVSSGNYLATSPGLINRNPKKTAAGAAGLGYYAMSGEDEDETVVEDEQQYSLPTGNVTTTEKEEAITYNPPAFPTDKLTVADPRAYAEEKGKRFEEVRGPDTVTPRMKKRLRDMEAEVTGQKEDAQYTAWINTGLAIAKGTSQNAITNIAEGGIEGMEGYVAELKDIREREDKIFDLDLEIEQAARKEKLAIAMYTLDSEQAAEARNIKAALELYKSSREDTKVQFEGDIDLRGKEISSTTYGYNTKNENARLAREKLYGIGPLMSRRSIIKSMEEGPAKTKALKDIDSQILDIRRKAANDAGLTSAEGTMPPQNFSGYSATEVTE